MVMIKRPGGISGSAFGVVADIELTEDAAQIDFDNLDGAADHGYTLFWEMTPPPGGDLLLATVNDIGADYLGWSNYLGTHNVPFVSQIADTGGACGHTVFYFDKGTGRVIWRSYGVQVAGDNPNNTWSDSPTATALRTPVGNLTRLTLRYSGGNPLKAGSRFLLVRNKA